MHARRMAIGLLALAALAFVAGTATAGDTIRLSLPSGESAPTLNLKATPDDLAADNVATRFGRGFGGGYRGGYGGYRGYRGGYGYGGGYRGYYGGGYRGYYGPRFYGSYYRPYYSSYYYSTPYYYPSYSGYGYYSPIGLSSTAVISAQTTVLRPAAANYDRPLPMPQADNEPQLSPSQSGTYPYDGGPQRQIPMPPAGESSVGYPGLSKPALVEDLVVKLPGKSSGKWTYPAYGETPSR
jgi:hypothetical protein